MKKAFTPTPICIVWGKGKDMGNRRKISDFLALRKLVRGFTIIELLVAMGLFAAVIAAAGMIFNYSLESQRVAAATAEIMRTLRAITDQLDIDFQGLRTDGYLVLWSDTSDSNDASISSAQAIISRGMTRTGRISPESF